jgi:hypothetical protein
MKTVGYVIGGVVGGYFAAAILMIPIAKQTPDRLELLIWIGAAAGFGIYGYYQAQPDD